MKVGGRSRIDFRRSERIRFQQREQIQRDQLRMDERFLMPGRSDTYVGPRSSDLRPKMSLPASTPSFGDAGFASGSAIDPSRFTAMPRVGSMSPQDIQSYVEKRQRDFEAQGQRPSTALLNQIVGELQQQGVPVVMATHAGGSLPSGDKFVMPNGQCIDAITDVDGSNPGWSFQPDGGYDPNVNIVAPDGSMMKYGDYLSSQGLPIPPYTPPAPDGSGMPDSYFDALAWLETFAKNNGLFSDASSAGAPMSAPNNTAMRSPFGASGKPLSVSLREQYPGLSLDPRSPDYQAQLKQVITNDFMESKGRPPSAGEMKYWLDKYNGPNDSSLVTSGQMSAADYWHRRTIGMGAGGNDIALFGPFAGGDA